MLDFGFQKSTKFEFAYSKVHLEMVLLIGFFLFSITRTRDVQSRAYLDTAI